MRVHRPQRNEGFKTRQAWLAAAATVVIALGSTPNASAAPQAGPDAGPDVVPSPDPYGDGTGGPPAAIAVDSDAPADDLDVAGRRIEDTTVRYPPSSVRGPIIGAGVAVLGVAYGVGALTTVAWPEVPGSDFLYVPVAGPWMALSQLACSEDNPDCGALLALRGSLLIVDGLAQLGGLIMVGEGFFMTTEADGTPAAGLKSLRVTPFAGEQATGFSIHGRF